MSQICFRQVARLEKLARPYLDYRRGLERSWQYKLQGVVAHAAILAFLTRYGNPQIGEPLSCAYQQVSESDAWRECRGRNSHQALTEGMDNILSTRTIETVPR